MQVKYLIISSLYDEYLASFYSKNIGVKELPYRDHLEFLLNDSTDFVSSYTRTYNKLGVASSCVIANDIKLQKKWLIENSLTQCTGQLILFEQVKLFKPEVLIIEDLRFVNKELLNKIRNEISSVRLIVAYHCAPFNTITIETLKAIDFLFTCTPGLTRSFSDYGIKSYLIYHGFDHNINSKLPKNANEFSYNLTFAGSLFPGYGYHQERIDLIEKILSNNIDISIFANLERTCKIRTKQCVYNLNRLLKILKMDSVSSRFSILDKVRFPINNYSKFLKNACNSPVFGVDMYSLLQSSKIVLNNHGQIAGEYAGNMRLFEVTGVGSCLLTDNKKNMKDLFISNTEIVTYDSIDDCIEKIQWLLNNENERNRIAKAGQEKTLKVHTVENRCRQIISIIDSNLSSR